MWACCPNTAIYAKGKNWYRYKYSSHEPTFSQTEFDDLERVLRRDTRTANGSRTVHLFSGFLRCVDCDKALQRKSANGMVYYACRTYTEKSKQRCTKHSIRIDVLETAVLQSIQAQIALLDNLSGLVDEIDQAPVIDTQTKRLEKLRAEKRRELEKVKHLSDSLYVDWKSGMMNQEAYLRRNEKFAEQEAQLSAVIANLEEELRRAAQTVTSDSGIFDLFLKYKNIQQLDRALLVELVDAIYVHEDKQITIQFRYFAAEICG